MDNASEYSKFLLLGFFWSVFEFEAVFIYLFIFSF